MHSNLFQSSILKYLQNSKIFFGHHIRQCSSIKHESKLARTNNNLADSPKKPDKFSERPIYGQPTSITHPHLIKNNDLAQGITAMEFQMRRQNLMERIQSSGHNLMKRLENHVVIIPSSTKKYMSDKIPYVFRQNSDFFYLSGCLEIDTILVMWIDESKTAKSALFMRPKDKHAELWNGARTGVLNARELFQINETYPDSEFSDFLMNFQKKYSIWYDGKQSDQSNVTKMVAQFLKKINQNAAESPTEFVHKLRVIKSKAEIELMRKTCQIASRAINKTMKESKPGDSEHHIFARVDYHCRMLNASYLAYPPVVASGNNATTIHYINNNQITKDREMVLMDAGCEYGGYTSDITRTWPINGKFTSAQRVLYEVLLTVQKELIDTLLKDGGKTLNALFDTMCLKLGRYLQEIGLIDKSVSGVELVKAAYSFCPHHVSHYLGMDVHDTPLITRNIPVVPGMVCTVEPGIYINENRVDVPKEFRGIGVRIEDDVFINDSKSVEVLTESCVKEPDLLEKWIQS